MMRSLVVLILFSCSICTLLAQQGIGTSSPNNNAVLHLVSANQDQGIIIPQVTTAKRPTAAPAIKGMMIFNVTDAEFQVCDGTSWLDIPAAPTPDHLGNHVATENLQMNGQWISHDGDAEGVYIDESGQTGIGTNTPLTKFEVKNGGFLVQGTTGGTPISGAGTRLMWVPFKGAIRAGRTTTTHWDDANIGVYSTGFGNNPKSSGAYSTVSGGSGNTASGPWSTVAGGTLNTTSSNYSTISGGINNTTTSTESTVGGGAGNTAGYRSTVGGGLNNTASGTRSTIAGGSGNTTTGQSNFAAGQSNSISNNYSFGIGLSNTVTSSGGLALGSSNTSGGSSNSVTIGVSNAASYSRAVAIGNNNQAKGQSSLALGSTNEADAHNCVAIGNTNFAGYDRSFAIGEGNVTNARYSLAMGRALNIRCHNTVAIGRFNLAKTGESQFSWSLTDPLFVVGNGTDDANRSNALMLLKNGSLGLGIDNPGEKLAVDGHGQFGYVSIGGGVTNGRVSPKNFVNLASDIHATVLLGSNLYLEEVFNTSAPVNHLYISKSHSSLAGAAITLPGNTQFNQGGVSFYTRTPKAVNTGNLFDGQLSMLLSPAGNLGIGTTAPTEKLDVAGKTKTTTFQMTTGANDGYVLTSDASGNAEWQAASGGGGWNDYAHFEDQKTSGSFGGAFSAGSWVNRVLNTTVTSRGTNITRSGSQITLAPGLYYVDGSAPATGVGGHQARFYNVTSSTTALSGTSESTFAGSYGIQTRSKFKGIVEVTTTSTFNIQHYASAAKSANGLGSDASTGGNEVFTTVFIRKVD